MVIIKFVAYKVYYKKGIMTFFIDVTISETVASEYVKQNVFYYTAMYIWLHKKYKRKYQQFTDVCVYGGIIKQKHYKLLYTIQYIQ